MDRVKSNCPRGSLPHITIGSAFERSIITSFRLGSTESHAVTSSEGRSLDQTMSSLLAILSGRAIVNCMTASLADPDEHHIGLRTASLNQFAADSKLQCGPKFIFDHAWFPSLPPGGRPKRPASLIDGEAKPFDPAAFDVCIAAAPGYSMGFDVRVRAQSLADTVLFLQLNL